MSGDSWFQGSSLNKLFGWQVGKKVRHLADSAIIRDFSIEDKCAEGVITASGKPQNCSFAMLSPTLLEGKCSCPVYRLEASLCEHIGLLYWHACGNKLKEETRHVNLAETKSCLEDDSYSYEWEFPDNWRTLWNKATLLIKCRVMNDCARKAEEADTAVKNWFLRQGEAPDKPPAMLALPQGEVRESFFRTIEGHPRIFTAKGRHLHIEGEMPLVSLSLEPLKDDWRLVPHLPSGYEEMEGHFWEEESQTLFRRVSPSKPSGWDSHVWEGLLAGESQIIEGSKLIMGLSRLQEFFELDNVEEYECLKVVTPKPLFSFQWDGGEKWLEVIVFADYGEWRGDFPLIPYMETEKDIHICKEHGDDRNSIKNSFTAYWRRNTQAEKKMVSRLEELGFSFTPKGWVLSGTDKVADFVSFIYPDWQREGVFRHEESKDFQMLKMNLESLSPKLIPLKREEGGWFEAQFVFTDSAGTHYSASEVVKLLQSGRKQMMLKGGKTARINQRAAEDWGQLFAESQVEQTSRNVYRIQDRTVPAFEAISGELFHKPADISLWTKLWASISSQCTLSLRPYQVEGVRWLWERLEMGRGALLGDDMGLGKTLQTLALFLLLKEAHPEWKGRPSLMVVPASLLNNWEEEIRRAFPTLNPVVLYGNGREEKEIKDLGITTYGLLTRDFARHKRAGYAFLAFDEASVVRNPDTDAADSLRRVPSDYKLALTGTPIENSIRDLWSVFEIVLPGYLGGRGEFKARYEQPISADPSDISVLRRLRHRVQPWILRRTKEEVAPELPPKITSIRWCELSAKDKTLYHTILREGDALLRETERKQGKDAARMIMLTTLLRLRQLCDDSRLLALQNKSTAISGKVEVFREMINELMDNGHRVLVFSQFASMLHLLRQELTGMNVECLLLDGSVRDRGKLVERFREKDGPPVFLISLKAGGYGLNLQAADTVIHFDPWWNPAVEAQATDRAYRIGQTRPVNVYKIICKGTLEEKILDLQEKKKGILSAAFGEDGSGLGTLSEEELKDLLN